jgi:hypothetical protein
VHCALQPLSDCCCSSLAATAAALRCAFVLRVLLQIGYSILLKGVLGRLFCGHLRTVFFAVTFVQGSEFKFQGTLRSTP